MELQDFVKTSLLQIIQGVAEAIDATGDQKQRSIINPTFAHAAHADPQSISFDVAVTVHTDTSIKGGGGISIAVFKTGADAERATANTAVSRISFSVPVALPSVASEQYPQQQTDMRARIGSAWD